MIYWVVVDSNNPSSIEQILSYDPGSPEGKTIFQTKQFEEPGFPVKWNYYTVSWENGIPTIVKRDDEDVKSELASKQIQAWRSRTSCGPLQFRRALRASGLADVVKAYIETADEEVVEAWEYATKIDRNDPFIFAVQQLLNKTDEEVDNLFKLALTYP